MAKVNIEYLHNYLNQYEQTAKINVIDINFYIKKKLYRKSFYEFIKAAWPHVEGGKTFIDNWHVMALARHLQACEEGEINYLIINIPPGCMKSTICSIMFPAWVWCRNPSKQFLHASYAQSLSVKDSVYCRRLIESDWYKAYFSEIRLMDDSNTKLRFDNVKGGFRIATSIGGATTGYHADYIIADDPNSAHTVDSPTIRESTNLFWDQVMSTRLNDVKTGVRILVQQRLHTNDLTGHILEQEIPDVVHLCLPMEFESKRKCKTIKFKNETKVWEDPRTKEGALLWPEFFGVSELDKLKKVIANEYAIAGQLQQRPSPESGGIFKREWFKIWKERYIPELQYVIQAWDTALSTEKTACASACCTWGVFLDNYNIENLILLDIFYGNIDYPTLHTMAKKLALDYHNKDINTPIRHGNKPDTILIEAKANGLSLVQDLYKYGIDAIPYNPNKVFKTNNKIVRARRASTLVEAGKVWLPAKYPTYTSFYKFADEFLQAAINFPSLESNDIIDATSMIFCYLKDQNYVVPEKFIDEE